MPEAKVARRGHGEDAIYLDAAKNRYVGAVSLGYGPDGRRIRRKVTGRTKAEVRDKLRNLHREIESGVRSRPRYTVRDALDDWLANALDDVALPTVELYKGTIAKGLTEQLGAIRLTALTARDVEAALAALASNVSTRTVQISRNVLVRAIRHAERHDLVGRNVAALVKAPRGRTGRPSKALTLEQATALLDAAMGTRLEAYIVVSLLAGLRTEEVRALRWEHIVAWVAGQWQPVAVVGFEHEQLAVFVWRSDRAGGDTKTPKSRRTLALPIRCVQALREQRVRQAEDRLAAGPVWRDHGLVFASSVGTPLDHHNVRREFRKITEAAGLGTAWVPRELRHSFVSLLSAHDVPVEAIALLAGHKQTATTELIYRHQLVPALTRGRGGYGPDLRPGRRVGFAPALRSRNCRVKRRLAGPSVRDLCGTWGGRESPAGARCGPRNRGCEGPVPGCVPVRWVG